MKGLSNNETTTSRSPEEETTNLDKTSNIPNLERSLNLAGGFEEVAEPVEAFVGNSDSGFVGFDGTERIVGSGDVQLGHSVEESRFANVGQSKNTDLHDQEKKVRKQET